MLIRKEIIYDWNKLLSDTSDRGPMILYNQSILWIWLQAPQIFLAQYPWGRSLFVGQWLSMENAPTRLSQTGSRILVFQIMENPRMDTELHRETDLENQMKTQAASHSFRDGFWLKKYETRQCEAWAVAQPRRTYIFIVRREALKPREGAGGPSPLTMLRNPRHSQMNKPIKPRTTKSFHIREAVSK